MPQESHGICPSCGGKGYRESSHWTPEPVAPDRGESGSFRLSHSTVMCLTCFGTGRR